MPTFYWNFEDFNVQCMAMAQRLKTLEPEEIVAIMPQSLFTSSILAIPCRVVVPLFKIEAQSSPTEPFFEKFVFIVPLNFLPPLTTKSIE